MHKKLTQAFADGAQAAPGAERTIYWDESMPGFGLMVTSAGHKSFVCQYRVGRRSRRLTLKGVLSVEKARKQAKGILGEAAIGGDPLEERRKQETAAANTFHSIAEEYLKRENKLRSLDQRRAMLNRLVYPKLGARPIDELKRTDIVRLLDAIEDERGPVMADRALATVRRIMNWHAGRSDDFRSPIVRGMARTRSKERARERTLKDDELRAVWEAAEASTGPFGPFVQFLLLTGARRSEAAGIARSELVGADWTLPAARNKTKVDLIRPLSASALKVLAKLPAIGNGEMIFTNDGERPLSAFSKPKRSLDNRSGVLGWTLHDLRRTARSLMSRAGVLSDHAEIALGHKLGGVRGTYDRHEYYEEKRRAFEALATQIERILSPQPNVVPFVR